MKKYKVNLEKYDEEALAVHFSHTTFDSKMVPDSTGFVRMVTFYNEEDAVEFERVFGDMINDSI